MNAYTPNKLAAALVVAFAPVILAGSVFIANEAQILFNMHLEGPALAAYISSFLVVIVAGGIKLLEHLAGKLIHDLVTLFERLNQPPAGVPPTRPQGSHTGPPPPPMPTTPRRQV